MKKFDKTKTLKDGYMPTYANNMFTMVNLKAPITTMKQLHGFCNVNGLPAGRIAKLQGGYYVLNDKNQWEFLDRSLNDISFGVLYRALNKLTLKPKE